MKTNKYTPSPIKGMPNAPEAEQAVIGSLLSFGGDKVFDAISPELNKDMFYDNRYAVLYDAIQSLYANNKPCDIVSVSNEIRSMGKIDEVPLHFIAETSNYGYDSFHVVEHALMVKQKYLQRKAIELSHILQQQAYDDTEDIGDVLFNAGKALEQMQQDLIGQSESQSFKDIAQSALKNIERKMGLYSSGKQTGITTGLQDLNDMNSGWHGGELIVLAARPAMGKTAVSLHFGKSAARQGIPVVIFSLEMDSVSLYERFIASESNVHPSKLRSGNISQDELQQIDKAIGGTLYSLPITINDNAAIGMSYIRAMCRSYHQQNNCGMVIIDYLQLITESSNGTRNREQEIARMSREAKIIAKELNVPVILLSQLNREVDKRTDKKPILADLRESGAIEQDADMVIFVHRPEYYGISIKDSSGHEIYNYGELIIAKHRNGSVGTVKFKHNGSLTKIFDYDTKGYTENNPF